MNHHLFKLIRIKDDLGFRYLLIDSLDDLFLYFWCSCDDIIIIMEQDAKMSSR